MTTRMTDRTGPTRREMLALGLACAGLGLSGGRVAAQENDGPRVACLEWTSTEMLLSLGVTPLAIGDPVGYREWVVAPPLPHSVINLGSRLEPNRELLLTLDPDLIVVSEGYGLIAADFEQFAPVEAMTPFSPEGKTAFAHAVAQTEKLAERLGREAAARTLVADAEATIADCRRRLAEATAAPVCVASIFEERSARIYGGAGLVGEMLDRLGLVNGWQAEVGPWGFATVGLEEFARLPQDVRLVIMDPVPEQVATRLAQSTLWNGLPPVRNGRVVHIDPVWPFGAVAAARRFVTLLTGALVAA